MSIPEISLSPDADPRPAGPGGPDGPSRADTWRLSRSGLLTVIRLELRQRVRSTRWVLALAIWTAVIAGLTTLIWWAFRRAYDDSYYADVDVPTQVQAAAQHAQAGRAMFGVVVFLVLALGSLVAPALSATSVNGDRAAGVLATLQTTLLTPAEIVLGKLLAAWATSLALLVTAVPFILWAYFEGGTPFGRLVSTLAVLVLALLMVCAIGLGWSAITARTTSSAVLTYLSVALLGLGLPLIFALTLPVTTQEDQVRVREMVPSSVSPPDDAAPQDYEANWTCRWTTQEMTRTHTERTWWLLAPNPFVIVADAAPRPANVAVYDEDPLSLIRQGVREARLGPRDVEDWCGDGSDAISDHEAERRAQAEALGPVWPVGLLIDLGLAAGFTVVAVRRLRTPSKVLPRGVRVA